MLRVLQLFGRSSRAPARERGVQEASSVAPSAPQTIEAGGLRLDARNARLRSVVRDDRNVWIISEQYEPQEAMWTVDLLREVMDSEWRMQRYKYDSETDVLYFWGERPITEADAQSLALGREDRFWP